MHTSAVDDATDVRARLGTQSAKCAARSTPATRVNRRLRPRSDRSSSRCRTRAYGTSTAVPRALRQNAMARGGAAMAAMIGPDVETPSTPTTMSSRSPVGSRLIGTGSRRAAIRASCRGLWQSRTVVADPQDLADLALVAEATRKTSLLWLRLPAGAAPRAAWHVWHDGAAYVVHGVDAASDEQRLPGIDEAELVEVTVRSKDTGGRIVVWRARPLLVDPRDEGWEAAAQALAGERLNAGHAETLTERWAKSAHIVRLEPVGG